MPISLVRLYCCRSIRVWDWRLGQLLAILEGKECFLTSNLFFYCSTSILPKQGLPCCIQNHVVHLVVHVLYTTHSYRIRNLWTGSGSEPTHFLPAEITHRTMLYPQDQQLVVFVHFLFISVLCVIIIITCVKV